MLCLNGLTLLWILSKQIAASFPYLSSLWVPQALFFSSRFLFSAYVGTKVTISLHCTRKIGTQKHQTGRYQTDLFFGSDRGTLQFQAACKKRLLAVLAAVATFFNVRKTAKKNTFPASRFEFYGTTILFYFHSQALKSLVINRSTVAQAAFFFSLSLV